MLDYTSLAALAAVVREGSFERAARQLNVTPSAISQRIRLLEERVGCALVVREQPCRATDAGQRLCQHVDLVRLMEQELQTALPSLESQDDVNKISVPLAVNADSLDTWLVPALADFSQRSWVMLEVGVDDQDHTAHWLRSGKVMAAVTSLARPATGCNSLALGAMRYRAVATPAFTRRYFPDGVTASGLAKAPSLVFNNKDELQQRWTRRLCRRHIALPKHALPSTQAFLMATLAHMGWGMHPTQLIDDELKKGALVELLPDSALDVALYWQYTRSASALLEGLSQAVCAAARQSLISP